MTGSLPNGSLMNIFPFLTLFIKLYIIMYLRLTWEINFTSFCVDSLPASCSQNGPNCTNRLPGFSYEKGNVTKFGHGSQKLHILRQSRLIFERWEVRFVTQRLRHHVKCFTEHPFCPPRWVGTDCQPSQKKSEWKWGKLTSFLYVCSYDQKKVCALRLFSACGKARKKESEWVREKYEKKWKEVRENVI